MKPIRRPGRGRRARRLEVSGFTVGPEYFEMCGLRLLRGRGFLPGEDPSHVVASERLASALWPGLDPVGRSFSWDQRRYEVVGLVKDVRRSVLGLALHFPVLYLPLTGRRTYVTIGSSAAVPAHPRQPSGTGCWPSVRRSRSVLSSR